jgi:hypothetical protein
MRADARTGKPARLDDRWVTFVAFWFLAALTLLVVGFAMFVAVAHSHRVASVLLVIAVLCLAVGFFLLRAGRRAS